MNVSQFVDSLTDKGVKLWIDDDKLKIHSPKGIITPEIHNKLATLKTEILAFLDKNKQENTDSSLSQSEHLSLQTIGLLIGGFCQKTIQQFKPPTINPTEMARKLKITFRPLPDGYNQETIIKFREELQQKLQNCGVDIQPWESATKEFSYEVNIPFTKWKRKIKTRVVKTDVNAIIDVERHPNFIGKIKIFIAELLYKFYSHFLWKNQKKSVSTIGQFISWAEENIRAIEDPTNTQVIVLTELNQNFVSSDIPYQQKIPIGVNSLVKTFSEIVIGVSQTQLSILNMNLSDSVFSRNKIDDFVLNSLIPKIYVPILPLAISRFEVSEYQPTQSNYASQLVKLGQELAVTGLLPSGFKIDDVIKRKSHRDIVDWMANGRTGVSYGFVAYIEPPQYIGSPEISEQEWENLSPVEGFNITELRQNEIGRRYLKTKIGNKYTFKQIPDIWLVSSRSGSNKTNLNLTTDILRIGLQDKLLLQLPQGIDVSAGNIKPSYDIYVMVAIALSAALYLPELIKNGAPIIHFHGYPVIDWFKPNNEYCAGVHNPSVPCGTYESGVFNFLAIHNLASQYGDNVSLASLIEPDHGTNIIASDLEYLLTRVKAGVKSGDIELGGKHFPSLKQNIN
ncbi:MAG: hypothetical protein AAF063_09755 [Cyanobacteria bacterium J06643_5]